VGFGLSMGLGVMGGGGRRRCVMDGVGDELLSSYGFGEKRR